MGVIIGKNLIVEGKIVMVVTDVGIQSGKITSVGGSDFIMEDGSVISLDKVRSVKEVFNEGCCGKKRC